MDFSSTIDNGKEGDNPAPPNEQDTPILSVWRQRILIIVLLSVQFSALCTDTFLFPFFPREAKNKGLTDIHTGLVFSAFELSRFAASPVAGYLVGKLKSKIICIVGGVLTTLCCISFGLITYLPDSMYLPLCILIRLLAGSGTAMLSVTITVILLKATSYKSGTIVGLMEMVQGAGYATGPALGAALYEVGGYTCMFWTMGSLMITVNFIQPFVTPDLVVEPPSKTNIVQFYKVPGIMIIFLHSFVCKTAGSSIATGTSDFITSTFDKPPSVVGIIFGIHSVIYIATCPVISKCVNKGFIYTPMLIGWSVYMLLCLFMGPSPILNFIFHEKRYFLLSAITMCSSLTAQAAIYIPPFQAALNTAVVNGHRRDSIQTTGMIAGVINSAFGLGSMIGPTMAGFITDKLDFTWTLTVIAGIGTVMLMVMIAYLLVMKITNHPLKPEDEVICSESTKLIDQREDEFTTEEMEMVPVTAAEQPQMQRN